MSDIFGVKIPMNPWVVLSLFTLAAAILAYLASVTILWVFKKIVKKSAEEMDDRIYRISERYLFPLLFIGALLIIVDLVPLPPRLLRATHRLLTLAGFLLAIFLLGKLALLILRIVATRNEPIQNIKGPIEIVTKIIFFAVGGMIILDNLGISLTPIITTLGIGMAEFYLI